MTNFGKAAILAVLFGAAQTNAFVVQGPSRSQTRLASSVSDLPADAKLSKDIWRSVSPTVVQGNSLRTFQTTSADRVQVLLKTEGRPLNSRVELWQGPDYLPFKLGIYLEDGSLSPFNGVVETPYDSNTIAVYNTGNLEFPLKACVVPDKQDLGPIKERLMDSADPITIQGGALRTYPFDASVASVQVCLKTDGRHLQARIELLQGPNNNKQIIQVYSSDGKKRSFYAVFETPEAGCVVRIVNEQTVEYPLMSWVEPYKIDDSFSATEPVMGGGSNR
ncbi:hypothetical protein MPSEU_000539100 [Mayamaea pseudoterrestris]|nr:hypothetical protein MPSEU_000539100 [Mayamaea pseudoterrestris]